MDNLNEKVELCDFVKTEEPPNEPNDLMEEDEPLTLLPPDHPLLAKFQQSLKEHLMRTKTKLANEIAELQYKVKMKEQHREEQGLTLYGMQQRIVAHAEQMKEVTAQVEEHVKNREKVEAEVVILKSEYEEKVKLTKEQKTLYNKSMAELEGMQTLGSNIKKWAIDVEDEVKNAKRIVSRDAQLQKQLSDEKRKSDILFYRLNMEVKKRQEELNNIVQEEETMKEVVNILNMSIMDANTDLEALQNEHKRLTQAWTKVIIAIQLRDKILFQVNENLRKVKESIKLNTTGIEAVKKQIVKEMNLNRKLESFKHRLADDCNNLKRECQKETDVLVVLQNKLEELPEWLARTEENLRDASREGTRLENDIRKISFKLNRKQQVKFQIEESILKLAQEQLITTKASTYRLKLLNKSQQRRRQMDLSLAQTQNQLAAAMLELEKLRGQLFKIQKDNDTAQEKVDAAETKCDNLDGQLRQIHVQIEIKMKRFDKLNQQLDLAMKNYDEIASSPTELKIKQIEKSIQSAEQHIREHQQFWIMLQNHFVNLSQKRNEQLNEIQVTRKQLSIMKQKSLKIDSDLEMSESRTKELKLNIQRYTSKQEILNDKIHQKRSQHQNEESECELEHFSITQKLKENEMSILHLEGEIDELQTNVELHKDLVLDMHREALSWETKYKLIEETIRWSKSEHALDSEISAMKNEIHRMTIRLNQLKRAQEKLVQDLEHCVMHREQIFATATVNESAKYANNKGLTQTQLRVNELRSKVKSTKNDIQYLRDERLVALTRKMEYTVLMLKKLQDDLAEVHKNEVIIRDKIDQGNIEKHANLEQLVRKQNRVKAYKRVHASKEPPKIRSETRIRELTQKQTEIANTLFEIVDELMEKFPEKKPFFIKIMHIINYQ